MKKEDVTVDVITLLIVEDESVIGMETRELVEELGYRVAALVESGERAVETAGQKRPDIVLMDIKLKGKMDGIEAAQIIRDHFGIPVIFLTAYADDTYLERAALTNPYGYITKPTNCTQLKASIDMALRFSGIADRKEEVEEKIRQSEKQYRELVEKSRNVILRVDLQGTITFVNRYAIEIFGFSETELLGRTIFETFIPSADSEGRELHSELRDILLDPEISPHYENECVTAQGERLWIAWTSSAVRDSDGVLNALFLSGQDITQRKRMERNLRYAQEVSGTGYWEKYVSSQEMRWSGGMYRLLGKSPARTKPSYDLFLEAVHPEDREKVRCAYEQAVRDKTSYTITYRFLAGDGTVKYIKEACYTEFSEEGTPLHSTGIIQDITLIQHYQDSLKWQLKANSAIAHCTDALLSDEQSITDIGDFILDSVRDLTGSTHGFLATIDPDTGAIIGHSLTNPMPGTEECTILDEEKTLHFYPNDEGAFIPLFAQCLNTRKPYYINDFASHPASGGVPDGHIHVHSFLTVPLVLQESVVGMIALVNSPIPYSDRDVTAVERFARLFVLAKQKADSGNALKESEARFRTLVENSADSIWEVDAQLRYLYVSPRSSALLGYSPDEMLGKTVYDFMDEGEKEKFSISIEYAFLKKERIKNIINIRRHKNGDAVIMETSGTPIFNRRGEISGFQGVDRDITERHRLDSELRILWRGIEQSPVSILITDKYGTIEYVNPFFSKLTGYSPEEAIGKNPRILKSGQHDDYFFATLWSTIRRGETWVGEIYNKKKNGELYWEIASISPIIDGRGDISHFIGVKEDITERKEMERLREDIERIMRHDLKTPLNSIINFPLFILESDDVSEENKEYCRIISESGRRMLAMINDYLRFTKIESGNYEAVIQQVDVVEIVDSVFQELGEAGRKKSVAMKCIVRNALPGQQEVFSAAADKTLLHSALTNLVQNAVEAVPKDNPVTVILDCKEGNTVDISIHNMGAVPEDIRDRFFDKYATSGKAKGNGLGTYSAKLMVERQGGNIVMETSETAGTTVTITLNQAEEF